MTWRRALLTLSAAIAAVIVVAALFLAWTATTPAGLRLAARVAASLAPGLEIEAPSGTLLGRLELGRIRWTGPLREIEAKEVVLQWRPSRLLDRLLRVEQLEIGELRVASRPDGTPAQAPIDLQLPVALQVERVRIGRLGLDTLTDKGPEPGLELSAIEGRLESDGQRHTLEALRLTTARLAVEASATLAGRPPFEVGARARIAGEERGHPFSVTLEAGGNLDDLVLKAQSASGTLSVDGEARIAVFAPQPLRRARLTATGLDPAAWVDGAPQADLRVEAALLPSPGAPGRLQGEVSIANARPGRLDEGRMPLRTLKATLHEEDGSLRIPAFTADLVAGKIAGTGAWAQGQLQMDATLTDVDAATWHGALKKNRLGRPPAGPGPAARSALHPRPGGRAQRRAGAHRRRPPDLPRRQPDGEGGPHSRRQLCLRRRAEQLRSQPVRGPPPRPPQRRPLRPGHPRRPREPGSALSAAGQPVRRPRHLRPGRRGAEGAGGGTRRPQPAGRR